jgi:hypothetical protein
MTAKVDSAAIQDGHSLYHHAILFDGDGNWTVVQQGMNPHTKMARRYHWISDNLKSFVSEPHVGIISERKNPNALDMTSIDSVENQELCAELAKGDFHNLQSSAYKVMEMTKRPSMETNNATLDSWVETDVASNRVQTSIDKKESKHFTERYEMPRKLNWNLFRKIYDIQPQNYEQLISIPGMGPSSVRALSLIGEIIFGTKASWQDPVKYNFAHGGKDGVPYPVARKTYDKSISYLFSAIEGAEIQRGERIEALKKLAEFSTRMFHQKKDKEIP